VHPKSFFFSLFQTIVSNCVYVITHQGPGGRTPIHTAVHHDHPVGIIELLCTSAVDMLTVRDHGGRLPIHVACIAGSQRNVIQVLLQCAPQTIHEKDGRGRYPIQLAVMHKARPGVIFTMVRLDKKCVEVLDPQNRTVLDLAIRSNAHPALIEELMAVCPKQEISQLSDTWIDTPASLAAVRHNRKERLENKLHAQDTETSASQDTQRSPPVNTYSIYTEFMKLFS